MIPVRWQRRSLYALLGAALAFSAWRVARPLVASPDDHRITLRFSHWQLEPGVREAFDRLARDYEALHPDVRIEQVPIPGRIYRQWTTSQLVGGVAPDLVQIGLGVGGGRYYGYFQPITAEAAQPNPYNAGTPLAGVPWRNTFLDGMRSGFDGETRECYGASLFNATVRLYCNLDLLERTTGRRDLPADFAELQARCAEIDAYRRRTGEKVEPIASSTLTGALMLDDLLKCQLQRLSSRLNPATDLPPTPDRFYLAGLEGRWTLQDPAFREGAALMRAASELLTPGFEQIENDQAIFRFVQRRAVMLMGFSLQSNAIIGQCRFPVAVFRNPLPSPADPRFGPQMVAANAENGPGSYGGFGITRSSAHPTRALDFLRFLTSQASCRKFAAIAHTLPTVVGVEPPASMRRFMPDPHGYPPGPSLTGWGEVRAALFNHQHALFGPDGSVDRFLRELRPDLDRAMRTDLESGVASRLESVRRIDPAIAASRELLRLHPDEAALQRKYDGQLETQNEMEADAAYDRLVLDRTRTPVHAAAR